MRWNYLFSIEHDFRLIFLPIYFKFFVCRFRVDIVGSPCRDAYRHDSRRTLPHGTFLRVAFYFVYCMYTRGKRYCSARVIRKVLFSVRVKKKKNTNLTHARECVCVCLYTRVHKRINRRKTFRIVRDDGIFFSRSDQDIFFSVINFRNAI